MEISALCGKIFGRSPNKPSVGVCWVQDGAVQIGWSPWSRTYRDGTLYSSLSLTEASEKVLIMALGWKCEK